MCMGAHTTAHMYGWAKHSTHVEVWDQPSRLILSYLHKDSRAQAHHQDALADGKCVYPLSISQALVL